MIRHEARYQTNQTRRAQGTSHPSKPLETPGVFPRLMTLVISLNQ